MILVIGVGVVGRAVISAFPGKVCFYDDKIKQIDGVPFFSSWDNISLIALSPGIGLDHDLLQEGLRRDIPITNDIGLFLNQNRPGIKIGITGSNGKSTTCSLLAHVLGERASLCGNIGVSPLSVKDSDFYILETSSFQLEVLEKRFLKNLDLGIITNISPTHISRHGSFEDYLNAKMRIFSAKKFFVGIDDFFKDLEVDKVEMPLVFPNNIIFNNMEYKKAWAIVVKVLDYLNVNIDQALIKAESFKPLKYRQEPILIKPIKVINDSKATNFGAVKCAFNNIEGKIVWIAGGSGSFEEDEFNKLSCENVLKAFVIGEESSQFISALNKSGVENEYAKFLDLAVVKAYNYALENNATLILSPGFASHDQFKNFEDRGFVFNSLVQGLLKI